MSYRFRQIVRVMDILSWAQCLPLYSEYPKADSVIGENRGAVSGYPPTHRKAENEQRESTYIEPGCR